MTSIDWRTLFISAEGRLARTPFLISAAILIAALTLYEWATGQTLRLVTGWLAYPALVYFAVCVLSKRLHDRGKSGWCAALVIIAVIGLWSRPWTLPDFIFLAIVVWAIVELAVLGGEQGVNRFGPNPLRSSPA